MPPSLISHLTLLLPQHPHTHNQAHHWPMAHLHQELRDAGAIGAGHRHLLSGRVGNKADLPILSLKWASPGSMLRRSLHAGGTGIFPKAVQGCMFH